MSATAASIRITASTDCPSLVPEAKSLTEIAGNIMKGLRNTVQELRLQELDDIGLLTSLEGLIADHNRLGCGKTQFLLEAHGDVNELPLAITGHIFHIVQEGLTLLWQILFTLLLFADLFSAVRASLWSWSND
jgi:signal transduction histidine kinase